MWVEASTKTKPHSLFALMYFGILSTCNELATQMSVSEDACSCD